LEVTAMFAVCNFVPILKRVRIKWNLVLFGITRGITYLKCFEIVWFNLGIICKIACYFLYRKQLTCPNAFRKNLQGS